MGYRVRFVVALLICIGTVNSIVLRSATTTVSFSSSSVRCCRFPTRLCESNEQGDATTDSKNWELMEDWSLQDKVPEFTVSSSSGPTTFWRQLKHTTPELSTHSEQELQERYKELKTEPGKETTSTPFIKYGDSPEVLSDWWMDVAQSKSSALMMMHGRLPNGSNIWFPLQSAGTIGSSTANNNNDNGFSWLLQDGDYIKYVESSAGCIYELGTRKPGGMETLFDNNVNETNESSKNFLGLDQFSSSTTSISMALSAVVASSLLSASLAFTAGQASLPPPTPVVQSSAIVPRQAVTPAITGSGMKYERTMNKDGSVKVVEMSIGEQRASQELKLYRDERRLTNLQDKLISDEALLRELTATEANLGPEKAGQPLVDGMPRSPKELSISEQRARAELKIGADKRRITKMKETLSNDKIKLKELQKQEKQLSPQRFLFKES